VVVSVSATN